MRILEILWMVLVAAALCALFVLVSVWEDLIDSKR